MKAKVLSFLNTFFTSLAAIFLIIDFGVSQEASAYLLSNNLFFSCQLICQLFTENFIYRYSELKKKSLYRAKLFYSNYLLIAFALSLLLAILLFLSVNLFINGFLSNLSSKELELCKSYMYILIPFILFYLPSNLSRYYMVANKNLELSFFYIILPSFYLSIGFIYNHFFFIGLSEILIFYVVFSSISILCLIFYTKPIFRKLGFDDIKEIRLTIIKSFKLKMAHNIHNIGLSLIISNLVTSFSSDYRSLFFYSKKASDAIEHITYTPSMKKFLNLLGSYRFRREPSLLKKEAIKSYRSSIIFITVLSLMVLFAYIFAVYMIDLKFNYSIYLLISFIFLFLKSLFILREIPWSILLIKNEKFLFYYFLNTTFLVLLVLFEKLFYKLDNLSLPISIMLSQIIISILAIKKSKILLSKIIV